MRPGTERGSRRIQSARLQQRGAFFGPQKCDQGFPRFGVSGVGGDRNGVFRDDLKGLGNRPYDLDSSETAQFGRLLTPDIGVPSGENGADEPSRGRMLRLGSDLLRYAQTAKHFGHLDSAW